ncbi:molybdenum ABC transporter ATP-binding protein [Thetidibacter halocola]|uniref:Molybdenum ABC transporter ATP-binding protein n=1 Tax=Thetidibacter halocola TaxID=2827239 RepID=A0A8J7WDR0_9RHOB|nr:molybdenum ABC transporter ATP-binding protein [Thetidibacter halocola]MBS0123476.1 molybdenum ABC transporter ATP-binding protein [Thetidibacter halocola]
MTLSVDLTHRFAGFSLNVAFDAPPGVTVLFGRSGSGKTSVVNAVAGLFAPEQGRIVLDKTLLFDATSRVSVPVHRRRLGYIFQEGRLFPHLTVRQNLAYGRWFAPKEANHADLGQIVDLLGIGPLLDRRPGALSGGEKQRVAIGRALLSAPRMILADEPLAALDDARKAEILPYLERLRDVMQVPMLYVTHSAAEVARLATTVVVLEGGRVIRQGGAAEVLADPLVTPTGIRAVGAVLEARVKVHHADGLTELEAGNQSLFLPRVPQSPGSALRIRIPAQDVILARHRPDGLSALNILRGTVRHVRAGEGPGALVTLDTSAGPVLARVTRRSAQALGLVEGVEAWAIIKTVALAPTDIGGP